MITIHVETAQTPAQKHFHCAYNEDSCINQTMCLQARFRVSEAI